MQEPNAQQWMKMDQEYRARHLQLYIKLTDHGQEYYREATDEEIMAAAREIQITQRIASDYTPGTTFSDQKGDRLTVQKIVARIQNAVNAPHARDRVEPLAWFLYDLLTRIETLEKGESTYR